MSLTLPSTSGVRKVVQGVRGENISAITENGRNLQNVPFETDLQLSDGNIILCIKIAQIPLYFALQVFLSNKHNNDRKDEQAFIKKQRTCHVCAELRSGHAPLSNGL